MEVVWTWNSTATYLNMDKECRQPPPLLNLPLCEMHDIATKTGTAVSALEGVCLRGSIETLLRPNDIPVSSRAVFRRQANKQYALRLHSCQRYQHRNHSHNSQVRARLSVSTIHSFCSFPYETVGILRTVFLDAIRQLRTAPRISSPFGSFSTSKA